MKVLILVGLLIAPIQVHGLATFCCNMPIANPQIAWSACAMKDNGVDVVIKERGYPEIGGGCADYENGNGYKVKVCNLGGGKTQFKIVTPNSGEMIPDKASQARSLIAGVNFQDKDQAYICRSVREACGILLNKKGPMIDDAMIERVASYVSGTNC